MEDLPEDEYKASASSVSNYAYKEEANSRFRPYMEDAHCAVDPFMFDPHKGYFAVFDGHGGREAVDYCKRRLHEELSKSLKQTADVTEAFKLCFSRIDNQLRLTGAMSSGTTATVALVRTEDSCRVVYVGNVGDSKAFLLANGACEEITYSHMGSDPEEIHRVTSVGGKVVKGRVGGTLAVSRSLGDHHLKDQGVISEPSVSRREVGAGGVLILGSDGVWDVIAQNRLPALQGRNSQEIAAFLVRSALEEGSQDNICALVICF